MRFWFSNNMDFKLFGAMQEGGHPFFLCNLGMPSFSFAQMDRIRQGQTVIKPTDFRFFLDSGAYSAWSRGTQIDLDEYCAFIKQNIDCIEVYASLDAIPGAPGRVATEKERHEAAEQSWANYLYMVNEGLDPLPVYHYGEDPKYLERMLDYGCPYIGIGGLVGVAGPLRRIWLDRVFDRITDAKGMPIVKTHGFGMTSVPLIFRYPWFSVDSTTWIKITANGALYLPAMVNGAFVFDQVPTTVTVSTRSPKQQQGGKSAQTMPQSIRAALDQWLAICGKTFDEVSSDYYHRAVCNVTFFRKVSEAKAVHPYERKMSRRSIWG